MWGSLFVMQVVWLLARRLSPVSREGKEERGTFMVRRVYNVLAVVRNASLTLTLHTDGFWSVHTRVGPAARISRAHWAVHVLTPNGPESLLSSRLAVKDVAETDEETPLGPARVVTVQHRPAAGGVTLWWRAYLYQDHPYLTLQVGVTSHQREARLLRLMPMAVTPPHGRVLMEGVGPHWMFFVDGWHSWSFAGVLADHQRQPFTRLTRFDAPMMYDVAHPPPRERGHFLSHTVGVLTGIAADAPSLVVGWTRQWDFVGLVEVHREPGPDPRLWAWADGEAIPLPPEEMVWSEPLLVQFVPPRDPDPLGAFAAAVGRMSKARVPREAPVGWCSWYHYYERVRPEDVQRTVDRLRSLRSQVPVNVIQVDDGYQAAVGDWLTPNERFADRMPQLAATIREAGFQPGLWLAPFIVARDARLAREHPDWLLRDAHNRVVNAGYLWRSFTCALDVTHPGVQEYLREVIETVVHRWGYTYLKLDFLYAGALPGRRHNPNLTRPQVLRLGLGLIREVAGDEVFLLGCGCPLGPAVGMVDAMRIGPDIAPHWHPKLYGLSRPWRGKVSYPAAANAVRNTLTRAAYHRRLWWNDPDCVLVRVRDNRLNEREVQSWLSVVGLCGGHVVWSDDVDAVPPERRAWLAALLPVQPEVGRPLDLMEHTVPETVVLSLKRPWGEGVTVGLFNWRDEPRTRTLQLGVLGLDWQRPHHVLDFWSGHYYRVTEGYRVFVNIPPHTGHVLGIKPLQEVPHLAGSTFHISQGGEIREWEWDPPYLRFKVCLGRDGEGTVLLGTAGLRLVAAPSDVHVSSIAEDVVALEFRVTDERLVEVVLK